MSTNKAEIKDMGSKHERKRYIEKVNVARDEAHRAVAEGLKKTQSAIKITNGQKTWSAGYHPWRRSLQNSKLSQTNLRVTEMASLSWLRKERKGDYVIDPAFIVERDGGYYDDKGQSPLTNFTIILKRSFRDAEDADGAISPVELDVSVAGASDARTIMVNAAPLSIALR